MQPESLVPFVISSYNKDASAQLQTQLESSLSEMMTSDVRIYDKMKKNENEQYVSVIPYVDKPLSITQKELYDSVINLVQSIGVSDTVHGKVQYVVPAPPKLQMKHMVQHTWTF